MIEYLQQLEYLEISECKCIQEIISKENIIKEAFRNRYLICFPRLNTLKLKRLQKLIGFCHDEYNVEFPTLKILKIESCPKLKGFIHNSKSKEIPVDAAFFNNKVAFPNLEKIKITHLKNAKRIWHSKLHTNSFSMLKELTVKECDVLLNIFPPFLLGVFQRLEKLIVIDCASLEEVFQFQVQGLEIEETCGRKSIKRSESHSPPKFEACLQQLERLFIESCGLEEIVSKNDEGSDEQEIWFAFNQLSFLMLWHLPYLTCFYPGIHRTTWSALKKLNMVGCWRIRIFGHEESQIPNSLFLIEKVIPQLEEVSFTGDCIKMISDGQYESDLFCNMKFLRISCYSDVSVVFLISFLRRFYNLESLELCSCSFKELASFENDACEDQDMIITIPKVKKLSLNLVNNIRHLWKQDSPLGQICASLECLEVWNCGNLINLGLDLSFSENLTTLDVFKCHEMLELITSSKARSLACLVTMRIRECERMREVVASDGDETSHEIVFRALKCLELHCLQSLTSFCSSNYALRFPSLEQFTLNQCPRMMNFNQGGLATPKLQKVQLTQTDWRGRWAGDLNATVEQLHQEQVGYHGLKRLKLSEFPKLVDIWSRNPQEMLDFTTLEFLEVCDSNNLRYIFNLSMAFGLGKLRQMEIKRCSNLEQVIKEEGPITMVEEAIIDGSKIISIFPRLQSILVRSCPNITSFYVGSKGLECPSLVEIQVADCSNMTTFISTFAGDEDKKDIIDVEVEKVATFFSDKVVFPNLEKLTISHLRNVKRMWLEKLIVTDCASLEEVFQLQLQIQMLDIEEACIVTSKLRQVELFRLPKLKHVWNKDPNENISFENLREVNVQECWGMHNIMCPMLKRLTTSLPMKSTVSGNVVSQLLPIEKIIPQLEHISLTADDIAMITDGQFAIDLFSHIKVLQITEYIKDSEVVPSHFFQRFSNLQKLKMVGCNFKKFSPYEGDVVEERNVTMLLPRINKLTLQGVDKMTHLWKQGSPFHHICENLETLKVSKCVSLISLSCASSSFQNLTTLYVWNCEEMVELITSSKAQCLEQLVTLKIGECEMMREVIASDGDETSYEIVFRELKRLELHCLQRLTSFCSRNYTLRFPSLEQVTLSQCPRMKNFNQGELTTPKLQKVQLTQTDFRGRWAGDLNATVEQLYQEQVGYRGLKHLKLSEFPELVGIWSRNPQEMLDFTTLEFLEVCDSNNLRYIFNLSMAFSLGQLQQLEIKRCGNLKQVINEEVPITMVKEAIIDSSKITSILPQLRYIIVESCPDMTNFYMGSKGLEYPSLVEIKIVDCSNMTTFVCTFSRDEDEEVIIGDEADNDTVIFSDKVAFPNLEKITISHLRNAKRIWHSKLHNNSFSMLKELTVKKCDVLLNIFPPFLLGVFQRLEKLIVVDCASLEEVFQFQVQGLDTEESDVVASQLREVNLARLPRLKHVWTKYHTGNISFESLQQVCLRDCWNLKTLFPFSIAKGLQQLERLHIENCGLEEIVSKNDEGSDEQEIWFAFNQLSFLMLWHLPYLTCFYPGIHRTTWSALKKLDMAGCWRIKIFGHEESQIPNSLFLIEKIIPQLEHISLTADDIAMITNGQFAIDLFSHIKVLQITEYIKDLEVAPFHFFQRFSNLQELKMVGCNFKEFSPYEGDVVEERNVTMLLPRINKLTLLGVDKMTHLWRQGSPFHHICASLETLEVSECVSVISLSCASSSFQNLTTLDVWNCEEMVELITSSKAQCFEQLCWCKRQ
ncbi:uncharacterized protein [Gossypium hirsutum]|uniref:Disease resistance protein At4g27190-like leucine-rich repeats domain-containing protein n=1 Tax=Gossypium hirsutum TaxID=3635 RepID=A0A1U8LBL0_GOSHI|nr:uncharacterized protein LOC107925790 [Gossypium hirsutum]